MQKMFKVILKAIKESYPVTKLLQIKNSKINNFKIPLNN